MLVQACLNAEKVCKHCFNSRAGAMNSVQGCLNGRKDVQSSFNHF